MAWGALQFKPGQTSRALYNLTVNQNFTIFRPVILKRKLIRHRLVEVETGLFKSYCFYEVIPDWPRLRYTYGVQRILLTKSDQDDPESYNEPALLPSGFVESLRDCCYQGCEHKTVGPAWTLAVGTRVLIKHGNFEIEGAIDEWSSEQRIRVIATLLQRDVFVTVRASDISKVL
jgi:hypothetical protein